MRWLEGLAIGRLLLGPLQVLFSPQFYAHLFGPDCSALVLNVHTTILRSSLTRTLGSLVLAQRSFYTHVFTIEDISRYIHL